MCTITLVAPNLTMATTELTGAACRRVCWQRRDEARTEIRPPRMSWVVVTDENHIRRMQIRWVPSAGRC